MFFEASSFNAEDPAKVTSASFGRTSDTPTAVNRVRSTLWKRAVWPTFTTGYTVSVDYAPLNPEDEAGRVRRAR